MTEDEKRIWNKAVKAAAKIAEAHKDELGTGPNEMVAIQRITCEAIAKDIENILEE